MTKLRNKCKLSLLHLRNPPAMQVVMSYWLCLSLWHGQIQKIEPCSLQVRPRGGRYYIVWMPKYRFRILQGAIKELVEHDIRALCERKGCIVEELNIQADHVHLLVSVAPKVSISQLMGTLKGKIAIKLFKSYPS